MSKSNEQKVEHIIQFITERKSEFTRCADAHKAFMAIHGKVSYVHFNRKFRELCPELKPTKKIRTLRPSLKMPDPPPKNKELKDNKRRINYYHRILKNSEDLLEIAQEEGQDKEKIDCYRDLRDRDRAAIVECYEELITFYEEKIIGDVEEVNFQLFEESIRHGRELDRMFAKGANMLIDEDDTVDKSFKKAASIVKKTKVTSVDIEQSVNIEVLQS